MANRCNLMIAEFHVRKLDMCKYLLSDCSLISHQMLIKKKGKTFLNMHSGQHSQCGGAAGQLQYYNEYCAVQDMYRCDLTILLCVFAS